MSSTQGNGQGVPWGFGKPEVPDYTKVTQGQEQLPGYPLQPGSPFGGGVNQPPGNQGQPAGGLTGAFPPPGAYPGSFGSADGWSGQGGFPPGFQPGGGGFAPFPQGGFGSVGGGAEPGGYGALEAGVPYGGGGVPVAVPQPFFSIDPYVYLTLRTIVGRGVVVETVRGSNRGVLTDVKPDHVVVQEDGKKFFIRTAQIIWVMPE
ncbi:YuzF family protein [Paenibacillus chitinolyticus]|uniref:YuzF family protein n=1 Tax=Paenibacillus chitinolyticus TaxID=79263 RepID=UPI001C45FF19|nr:YuzF family protein [Paenibacillus chitinolyticus]MBV6714231.1 YuzF family protein [Paenibacillus chitinolyticus]